MSIEKRTIGRQGFAINPWTGTDILFRSSKLIVFSRFASSC